MSLEAQMQIKLKLSFLSSIGFFLVTHNASAQVIPDSSLGKEASQVTSTLNQQKIEGGAIRGSNLFHSFQEFNVKENQEVFFNNPTNIENIFTRVTGGNLSQIDGIISNAGQANLFLINPNGIIFGENSSLQLGGSFFSSTANSILFPNEEFSATKLNNPPLMTINVPIGLNFSHQPKDIIIRSNTDDLGLQVKPGQNISLIGGNIDFPGGKITTSGTNIWLGGLSASGTIKINHDGSLVVPQGIPQSNVSLSNQAIINSTGGGGKININAANLTLTEQSELFAGMSQGSSSFNPPPGKITINATNLITINQSRISTEIEEDAKGEAGEISLISPTINIYNESEVIASTFSEGNAGNIDIKANDSLNVNFSKILSQVKDNAVGNAGNITIAAKSFTVNNESFIIVDSYSRGDAGNIKLDISGQLLLDGGSLIRTGFENNGIGKEGKISVNSPQKIILNKSTLSSGTRGLGKAGDINLQTDFLSLDNKSNISSSSNDNIGEENGESILIEDDIISGDAGTISINSDNVILNNESGINVFTSTNKNGGEININANTLELKQGGNLFAATNSGGNAGNIQLNVKESIFIDGANVPKVALTKPPGNPILNEALGKTGILVNTLPGSQGNGGNITIGVFPQKGNGLILDKNQATNNIIFANSGSINADSAGTGKGGTVEIKAENLNLNQGEILASTNFEQAANIVSSEINLFVLNDLVLQNNSLISAEAINNAIGGNVNINAGFIIAYSNSNSGNGNDILANADQGKGGNIKITTEALLGIKERQAFIDNNTNDIDASSNFGLNGNVFLEAPDVDPTSSIIQLENTPIDAEAILGQNICQFEGKKIAKGSFFTITGRGGLMTTAQDSVDNLDNVVKWANLEEIQVSSNNLVRVRQRSLQEIEPIIQQSQGWVKTSDGSVWLVSSFNKNILPESSCKN